MFNLIAPFIRLPVVGLDISDRSMKYLKFRRAGTNRIDVDYFGELDIPEGLIANGEIRDVRGLTELLREWRVKERKKIKGCFFAVSLPEEKSFLRLIQIPRVPFDDIPNAVRWEIENQIPFAIEDVIFDYELVTPLKQEDAQDHFDAVIVAFPKAVVESYVRSLEGAELPLLALELESQAITRACIASVPTSLSRIILDVGRTRTSIIIFSGTAIVYTSTIDLGGLIFEKRLAKALNISMDEATVLKKEIGLNKREHDGDIFRALAPMVSVLTDELVRATEFYQQHPAHVHGAVPAIHEILLCGGDANLIGLDTYLASIVKVPVIHADPFTAIRGRTLFDIPPIARHQALAFTTTIGLALRA